VCSRGEGARIYALPDFAAPRLPRPRLNFATTNGLTPSSDTV
jgi:hypothetical protein